MRIALAQIDTTVGDMEGNAARCEEAVRDAQRAGAGLVVLPELALTGYPPRDLVDRDAFVRRNLEVLDRLAANVGAIDVLVGYVARNPSETGRALYNSAARLRDGRVVESIHKSLLPNYDVFDEVRHFEPGPGPGVLEIAGRRIGVTVCEDIWNEVGLLPRKLYHSDPLEELRAAGVDAVVNLSASPYILGKDRFRFSMLERHAKRYGVPFLQTNLVGGNDDLVFDGNSYAVRPDGRVLGRGRAFAEDLVAVDLDGDALPAETGRASLPDEEAAFRALALGVADYVRKSGFRDVVLGLSGGIDSSVVAAIAAEALGPDRVLGVAMPSEISSRESLDDARELADLLGISLRVIPIAPLYHVFVDSLAPCFEGREPDVTEENLQSRIRGTLLMALSNKFGSLVLSTGNKSELAVGYCTLYGDMNGGLSVISDLPKTLVYRVARFANRSKPRIPERVIEKPPSAELRPDQVDTDSLPPYEVLDPILEAHVENGEDVEAIVARGYDEATVQEILRLVLRNEYKRRQAALGIKVTSKAFGLGRQVPIVNRFV